MSRLSFKVLGDPCKSIAAGSEEDLATSSSISKEN